MKNEHKSSAYQVKFYIIFLLLLSVNISFAQSPDLTISNLSNIPEGCIQGNSFNMNVTVNRSGGNLVNGTYVQVKLYASNDQNITTGDIEIGVSSSTDFLNSDLNAYGSVTRTLSASTSGLSTGNYYIGAYADPTNYHPESNESNNSRSNSSVTIVGTLTVTYPNSSGIVWTKGESATVNWSSSSNVSGYIQIQYYKGGTGSGNAIEPAITQNTVPVSNGTHTFTVSNDLTAGSDYLISISAVSGHLYDFSDNYFTIENAPLPDLSVSNITNVPSVCNYGEDLNLDVTVRHTEGPLTSGDYVLVRLYASTDASITTSDYQIGESSSSDYTNSALNASEYVTRTLQAQTASIPAPGNYYIGAIVDPTDFHQESNENNNSRANGSITTVGRLNVTDPNAEGIVWTKGLSASVSWEYSTNLSGTVLIQYYKGGTGSGNAIEPAITNNTIAVTDGTYEFTVSEDLDPGSDYLIGISAMSGAVWDFSEVYFTIQEQPTPQVSVSPEAGPIGTEFSQPGTGFTLNSTAELHFKRPDGSETDPVQETTDGSGNYEHHWTAEQGAQVGVYDYWAIDLTSGLVSNTVQFTVWDALELLTPAENEHVTSEEIYLSWTDVGAESYDVMVDNNEIPSTPPEALPGSAEIFKNVTETEYTVPSYFLAGGVNGGEQTYYWKVRANYSDGSSQYSDVSYFHYNPPKIAEPYWVPLYRLYSSDDKDHFYCTSEEQKDVAITVRYKDERVEGHISSKPFEGTDLAYIFRLYNSTLKAHYYTIDGSDKDLKIQEGYNYEGVMGFTYTTQRSDLIPMYKLRKDFTNPDNVDHFYTTSRAEQNNALNVYGFTDEGIIFYVSPQGSNSGMPVGSSQIQIGSGMNTGNGNFRHYTKTSFAIPSMGPPLTFAHIYNSSSVWLFSDINPLGSGWSHSYNSYVVTANPEEVNQNVYIVWPNGNVHTYYYDGVSYKCQTPGVYDILNVITAPSHFTVTKKDQTVYTFQTPAWSPFGYPAVLTSIADKNGNTISLTYESTPVTRLKTVTGAAGRTLSFFYKTAETKEHLLSEVRDNSGCRSIYFDYDDYSQDSTWNLIKFTDAKSQVTTYSYYTEWKQDHLLENVNLPEGHTITTEYVDPAEIMPTVNQPGKLAFRQQLGGPSGTIEISYSDDGLSSTSTDAENVQVTYYYSEEGYLDKIEYPAPVSSDQIFERTDIENPTKITSYKDLNGNYQTYSYDARGNVLQINREHGITHKYEYDSKNNITLYTDPRNNTITYVYDGNGNLTSVTDPRGTTQFGRNTYGQISSITNPNSHTMGLYYNSYGNVNSIVDPLSHTTDYNYDPVSRITNKTNAGSQQIKYTYDENDNLETVTDDLSNNTNYSYDNFDRLDAVTNARNGITNLEYNEYNRLISFSNPSLPASTYTYRNNGQLQSKVNPNNTTLSYGYDANGRLINVNSNNGDISASFSYDANGNIKTLSETGTDKGSMNFNYDKVNRLLNYTDYYGNTVSYTYDETSNIKSITYPGNKTVNYTYYNDNLLNTVEDWFGNITTYTYRNDGSIQEIQYPNGDRRTYSYDDADRVTGITITSSGGIIAQYTFTLDELGNHTGEEIEQPLSPNPELSEINKSYTYDAANRIQSAGDVTYTFDDNGNLESTLDGSNTITYSWDSENRLTQINKNNVDTTNYVYDIFGHRRQAIRNSITTRYVLDINGSMSQVLMETDDSNTPINYYIYGLGLIARIKADGTIRYYHSDFRGSTIAMTDPAGNITHKYAYQDFGKVIEKVEEDSNPFRYVGAFGVMDEDNGLFFMRARYYDFEVGRFVSEDPIWDVNSYVYASNGPFTLVDPKGQSGFSPSDLFSIAKKSVSATIQIATHFRPDATSLNPFLRASSNWGRFLRYTGGLFELIEGITNIVIERNYGDEESLFLQISSESGAIGFNIVMSPGRFLVRSILVGDRLINRSEFNRDFNRSVEQDLDFVLRSTTGKDVRRFIENALK